MRTLQGMNRFIVRPVVSALLLAVGACATYERNVEAAPGGVIGGYRFDDLSTGDNNAPNRAILLAFSGGGVRASAFAFGALEQLRAARIDVNGERRSVLDEVDVISANSGGSYTAAYYGLFRDKMFDDGPDPSYHYDTRFLKRGFEGDIVRAALSPANVARLLSVTFNRTDLAAEILGREVFRDKTFADLAHEGRPFIVLNTHDIAKSSRFQFTQEYFDYLCSDLSGFPVARAVMASSAVHGLFGPVRLVNYPNDNCGKEPIWVRNGINDLDINPGRFKRAKTVLQYVKQDCWDVGINGETPSEEQEQACRRQAATEAFAFQNDGGAVDNLGLRSLLLSLASTDGEMSVLRRVNNRQVDEVLLISINAANEPDTDIEASEHSPDPIALAAAGASSAIDVVTLDSIQLVNKLFRERSRSGDRPVIYHDPVFVSFDQVAERDVRRCLKNIGTRLSLKDEEIDEARYMGRLLIYKSETFRAFIDSHSGTYGPEPTPPERRACS